MKSREGSARAAFGVRRAACGPAPVAAALLTLLIAVAALGLAPVPVYAAKPAPETTAASAVLIDAKTGKVLYDKDMHAIRYPASLTKVMTGLLTLEYLQPDRVVTIDAETPFTKGSRIYLLEGEQVTVEQLFHALMIESANDAAVALAKEISGTTEAFAALMNRRAKELGALHTNFVNPNGLEDDAHVTTAHDIAVIAMAAMRNPEFRKTAATYPYTLDQTNKQETRYFYNGNRLLYDEKHTVVYEGASRPIKYADATGIKTGYTAQAGNCLAASAARGDTELIAVMLGAEGLNVYLDAISLFEYGFDNYKSFQAIRADSPQGEVRVKNGAVKTAAIQTRTDAWVTIPASASPSLVTTEPQLPDRVAAPVTEGQVVGSLRILLDGEELGVVDLTSAETVPLGGPLSRIGITDETAGLIRNIVFAALGLSLFLLLAYVGLKRRQIKRRKRRRAERRARLAEETRKQEELRRNWMK
ncbi:MAG: D-alanyl-D-alanine carboxypeptidase [Clostridiales Family XIII bacterium]|jgi:D-alanyl-D-alanine carboxypeptidase (penicillin-binding protein 5/6)|nr:D-alanyl-D-alanine carboxypeptidase [Clostridiales Family XIII bacterium]